MPDPATPPDHDRAALVTALRSAGCVYAEEEAEVLTAAAGSPDDLRRLVEARISGVPLEHVVGWAEFCGLRIVVEPGVFVPRRRTEFLARQAVDLVRATTAPLVADLCCGSGALAAAVSRAVPGAELFAVDIDPVAVRCARRNVAPPERVLCGDLCAPLPAAWRGRIDLIVANAPYVPTAVLATMPGEAVRHEATVALDGGTDGLEVHRRLAVQAAEWLAPGGHVVVEVSEDQAAAAGEIFERHALRARIVAADDMDATVVVATRQPGP